MVSKERLFLSARTLSSALCFFRFLSSFFSQRIATLVHLYIYTYTALSIVRTTKDHIYTQKREDHWEKNKLFTNARVRERDWSRRLISDRFTFDY